MIRLPAVAGRFYPDDPERLRAAVDSFLAGGERASFPMLDTFIRATLPGKFIGAWKSPRA